LFVPGSYGISDEHLMWGNFLQNSNNSHGHILWFKIADGIEGFVNIRRVYLIDLSKNENCQLILFRYTCVVNHGNYFNI
jgi:hypothetical protein